jgi:hypothetical protein
LRPDRLAPRKTTSGFRSAIGGIQTNNAQDALEIVIAVVFDFDPAAFQPMMNGDIRAQVLTQFVL